MANESMNKRLLILTMAAYFAGLVIWTILFYHNPLFQKVLLDVHLIYTSTIIFYIIVRHLIPLSILDFMKVFVRVLFRVWLLIFITFAISRSMERVGVFLSLTFMFGYFEALLDINKWLESSPHLYFIDTQKIALHKTNHALLSVLLLSLIHILCALAVFDFYILYGQFAM